MADFSEQNVSSAPRRRLLLLGVVCLVLGLAVSAALPGCGGCRRETAQEKKEREEKEAQERAKKKKEKPKPNFEVSRLTARPTSGLPAAPSEPLGAAYKPRHWTATTLEAKANNFDFVGDLEIVATDGGGKPFLLEGAPYDLTTSCQVTLVKRQRPKPFESVLFVPITHGHPVGSCRLNSRRGGRRAWQTSNLLRRMPPYQYHLIVISGLPENYAYLKGLPSVRPPTDTLGNNPTRPYYCVSLIRADRPDPRRRLPLPSYGLLWTSVACVLWDDAEPKALDRPQQEALLDWLHWGGQLIISGPDTLDKLGHSFLTPYLPATAEAGARQLSQDDFEELYRWSAGSGKSVRRLAPAKGWTGVKLQKHPEAQFLLGSGKLLVERRVGRGRIVVSAFGLSGRALRSWPAVDELFNAFLLRRPARRFVQEDAQLPDAELDAWAVRWADGHPPLDAGRICNLRYFSRDLCRLSPVKNQDLGFGIYLPEGPGGPHSEELPLQGPGMGAWQAWNNNLDMDESLLQGAGVAAWSDFNPVANSARSTLKNAAEIEIPSRGFVVWVVAGYLLVLVPANWAVFRVINRVEWAWAAAPVIAVACTVVVIRMAQLDIGFIRSRTEIALVELQADYPRAHVTRYTALYTSLTTSYEFRFEDPGALVLPFPEIEADQLDSYSPRGRRSLLFRRGAEVSLTGFSIQSNKTGMIHSEQMVDLGGGLSLVEISGGRLQLVNRTRLTLRDVGVVKRDQSHALWTASLTRPLGPGGKATLRFGRPSGTSPGRQLWGQQPSGTLLGAADLPAEQLSLIEAAQDVGQLRPGQARMVAWLDEQIPGLEVRPSPPQTKFATLVVAHLKYDFGEDPQPDVNSLKVAAAGVPQRDTGKRKIPE